MIVSKLKGGLANQMFQWAYAKRLSLKYNKDLYIDTSFYQNQIDCTQREFSLKKFPKLKFDFFDCGMDISYFQKITDSDLHNDIDSKKNYFLDGWFASEKYFDEYKDCILESFSYTDEFVEKLKNSQYKNVLYDNVTSLHVRRTDYVNSNYHNVLTEEYYKKSIEIISNYDYLFVFSDDIDWCKENFSFKNIVFVEEFDDIEDLWLMSLCNNNIIANSTFSWWASYLNKNPNKKIISPINWFNINNHRVFDIIPDSWIKI
jgi:hypothetical protein